MDEIDYNRRKANGILRNSENSKVIVSIGTVDAISPMVYDGVGASTHVFWQILSQINHFNEKDLLTKP